MANNIKGMFPFYSMPNKLLLLIYRRFYKLTSMKHMLKVLSISKVVCIEYCYMFDMMNSLYNLDTKKGILYIERMQS